jgi:hypothetical protein
LYWINGPAVTLDQAVVYCLLIVELWPEEYPDAFELFVGCERASCAGLDLRLQIMPSAYRLSCRTTSEWCVVGDAGSIETGANRMAAAGIRQRTPRLIYYGLGIILLVAAILKTWQVVSRPIPELLPLNSKWAALLLVEWQILLGIWLLSGKKPRSAWWFATLTFSAFSIVSLMAWWTGQKSCGCFGEVAVSPMAVFLFDAAAVAGLIWCRKQLAEPQSESSKEGQLTDSLLFHGVWGWALLGACITGGVLIAGSEVNVLSASGIDAAPGELVLLEPQDWLGKQLPMLEHIKIDDNLRDGRWQILLFHADCPKCQEVLPHFAAAAREAAGPSGESARFAVVDVDPHEGANDVGLEQGACVPGQLNQLYDWFVTTPVEITTEDGIVTNVRQEFDDLLGSEFQ